MIDPVTLAPYISSPQPATTNHQEGPEILSIDQLTDVVYLSSDTNRNLSEFRSQNAANYNCSKTNFVYRHMHGLDYDRITIISFEATEILGVGCEVFPY